MQLLSIVTISCSGAIDFSIIMHRSVALGHINEPQLMVPVTEFETFLICVYVELLDQKSTSCYFNFHSVN